ncbi:MAG: hypothetical protein ACKOWF_14795 [Chloroflexota bacterium]
MAKHTTRRAGLAAAIGALAAGAAIPAIPDAEADRKKRKARPEGPCGDGSAKSNRCKGDGDCCTGICRKVKKKGKKTISRCRCNQRGQSCSEDRNCCNSLTCVQGTCKGSDTGGGGGGGGGDTNVITVGPNDDLQAAIDNAPPGAVVVLQAGTYTKNLKVEKSLTLRGASSGLERHGRAFAAVDNTVTMQNSSDGSRAVEVTGSGVKLTLENVTVAMNSGFSTGGGIKVTAGAGLELLGSTKVADSKFTLCDAAETNSGGAVCLIGAAASRIAGGTVITTNEASPSTLLGGGVFLKDSTLTIEDTALVTANKAARGAGIHTGGTSTLTVQGNAMIDANTAESAGGGILAGGSGAVNVLATAEVSNNTVSSSGSAGGGGIFAEGTVTVTLGGKVHHNTVTDGPGGGIVLSEASVGGIDGGSVEYNTCSGKGGGVYKSSTAGLVLLNTVSIKENTSSGGDGGGLAAVDGTVNMTGGTTTITLNNAVNGGGIYLDLPNPFTPIGTISITSNTATGIGGGVYQTDKDPNTVAAFTVTTVSGNTDSGTCAGYYINNVDCILT